VPGLGASFGRGAATNYQQDLANSDCILIMGSNMAEAHPVGFRYPMQAKEKGAKLIHVDPRYSRTSAMCNEYVAIRAGTDVAFFGGLIHYVLKHDKWFHDYVLNYTNAATIIESGFQDTEDLDGVFSGLQHDTLQYSPAEGKWGYKEHESAADGNQGYGSEQDTPSVDEQTKSETHLHGEEIDIEHVRGASQRVNEKGIHSESLMGGSSSHATERDSATDANPHRDDTLEHPRCVMQILRRHFQRYTPEMVSRICGCSEEEFLRVAELLCENSGRERTSAIVYAVGWTQHTNGVQIIRAAGILQLLLGNIGRPGGGIMAMRGHTSIQGSTDIPTLYDLLPGYLPQPIVGEDRDGLDEYVRFEGLSTGYWANTKKFVVSLLKAYWGDAAQADNDYRFHWLPHLDGDYSQLPYFERMTRGEVEGYILFGQNPAGGGPNAKLHRAGLRQLKWLVVHDWFEIESATFWRDDPTGPQAEEIGTEVFFLPVASIPEKEGSFTNTQRLLQWHDQAIDPPGDCRSDSWWVYQLGRRLKQLYSHSQRPEDQALLKLTWDYDRDHPHRLADGQLSQIEGEPDIAKVLKEINGYDLNDVDPETGQARLLSGFESLKDDGTTSCGCWIYSGVFPEPGRNRARERQRDGNPLMPHWGFAWPNNRRIMYNRASADPAGQPWSQRKRLLYWDPQEEKWMGDDVPDFPPDKPPHYRPDEDARGMDAIAGHHPFIMKPDGVAWLFSPGKSQDGPLPTHYEPVESPVGNLLYPHQHIDPTTRLFEGPLNPLAHTPTEEFPIVACTFRVTEHYLSGPMSRFNSWLNELMPAMFVELSPELAAEHGIRNGDWVAIASARGEIEARALVTRRIKPLGFEGRTIHQIGLPFHWGYAGETVGSVANDLTSLVTDPNVSMHEGKVFACRIRAGRVAQQPRHPTAPFSPWPKRTATPGTPPQSQPEGQF
jgi:formate dehydrogenase major subunit